MRTCVSCRGKAAKRELLRVVSSPDSAVAVDASGKRNGRGAYVCDSCRQSPQSLSRARLEHSLKTKIGEDEWRGLLGALSAETGGAR